MHSYCLLLGNIPTASLCWYELARQSAQGSPAAQHQKHTDPEGQQFRAFGAFLTLSGSHSPLTLLRKASLGARVTFTYSCMTK